MCKIQNIELSEKEYELIFSKQKELTGDKEMTRKSFEIRELLLSDLKIFSEEYEIKENKLKPNKTYYLFGGNVMTEGLILITGNDGKINSIEIYKKLE